MHGQNVNGKNLPPELTRSKANTKAIAFCRHKLQGLSLTTFSLLMYWFKCYQFLIQYFLSSQKLDQLQWNMQLLL